MADKTTFVKITNREIYESILRLHSKVDKIGNRQALIEKATAIGGAILTILAGFLFEHITK